MSEDIIEDTITINPVELVLEYSRRIQNTRNLRSVASHFFSEVMELDEELGLVYEGKQPGPDGILGEGVDVILCTIDLIYQQDKNVTADKIIEKIKQKLDKWERLYANA